MIKYMQYEEYESKVRVFHRERVERFHFNFSLVNQIHREGEYIHDKYGFSYTTMDYRRARVFKSTIFCLRFANIEIKSVKFEDSLFENCYFEDVRSTNTFFENCTFKNTMFYNTGTNNQPTQWKTTSGLFQTKIFLFQICGRRSSKTVGWKTPPSSTPKKAATWTSRRKTTSSSTWSASWAAWLCCPATSSLPCSWIR